jgi:hypothetical protein
LLKTAVGTGTTATTGTGAKVAATNCPVTCTTMVGNICIEWKTPTN